MTTREPIKVLVLNASLKHEPHALLEATQGTAALSSTGEVAAMVIEEMSKLAPVEATEVRLADKDIPVGLGFRESESDEWPAIVEQLIAAQVVLFATPIWWGGRSSLMQRVIERMDAFDEEYIHEGRAALLNKVAGIVITGSEDGAQAVAAGLMEVLSFMNFTLPPQCCTYWVGETGLDPATDAERRRANPAVLHMAQDTAKGLVHYAKLINERPMAA